MAFLVGAPRSGTNWLQRMLAAHPDVVTLPSETHLFSHGLRMLDDQVQHGLLSSPHTGTVYLPRSEWIAAMRSFCVLVYSRTADSINASAGLVVERTPHHVEHLGLIGEVFPDAWFIHIVRDGRDVTRSLARQAWGPGDVAAAAEQWSRGIRAARAAAPSLAHYIEVRYEDLLTDTGRGMSHLFTMLGLPVDDGVLTRVKSAGGVTFNVDPHNAVVGEGKWRTEWGRKELDAFRREASDVLAELGYADLPLLPRGARARLVAQRRRLRARLSSPRQTEGASAPHAPVIMPAEAMQMLIDETVAAAEKGMVIDRHTSVVTVHYTGPGDSWTRHGMDGVDALRSVLASEGDWGRQVRGHEQLHGRTAIVTLTHEDARGSRVDRVLVLGATVDARLAHVGYLRFPTGAAGEEGGRWRSGRVVGGSGGTSH